MIKVMLSENGVFNLCEELGNGGLFPDHQSAADAIKIKGQYNVTYILVEEVVGTTKWGSQLVAEERIRQVKEEGYTSENDDAYPEGALAFAGATYVLTEMSESDKIMNIWPWDIEWFKPVPDDRIRELTKAGALIVAEIDRLIRKQIKESK